MIQEFKEFKFSTFAILMGWLIFTLLFTVEGFVIVLLSKEKEFIGVGFLLLFVLLISYEGLPKLLRFTKFYLQNKPAIILSKDQLIDNVNNQIFDWVEIKKIQYNLSYQANHISIEVKNPSKFIKKELNAYNRLIMKLNSKYFNGTFSLKPALIRCKKELLIKSLNEFLKKSSENNLK
jgi:hypothetical protein